MPTVSSSINKCSRVSTSNWIFAFAAVLLLCHLERIHAFLPRQPTAIHNRNMAPTSGNDSPRGVDTLIHMSSTTEDYTPDGEENAIRVKPGTHDELMYALGVNLARQLGDIRPLVENGEELSMVAKGLLDTVVGRLNDDTQRLLLQGRGKELDALILERA